MNGPVIDPRDSILLLNRDTTDFTALGDSAGHTKYSGNQRAEVDTPCERPHGRRPRIRATEAKSTNEQRKIWFHSNGQTWGEL